MTRSARVRESSSNDATRYGPLSSPSGKACVRTLVSCSVSTPYSAAGRCSRTTASAGPGSNDTASRTS